MTTADASHFNVTHQLRRLSFGTDFPGQANPLDGAWTFSPAGAAVARYFLKVGCVARQPRDQAAPRECHTAAAVSGQGRHNGGMNKGIPFG
jgi:hypothetical protein